MEKNGCIYVLTARSYERYTLMTAQTDKYYVYRPMLELISKSEGTLKGDGYNETLGYGAYTGGDVNLVEMTLTEVDALQTKMLKHPDNHWKSSAVGMYQIVRTTKRSIQKTLGLDPKAHLFDADMQDRMACFLLGQRGIDKWLSGRLKLETLINNLAKEWASLPTTEGKGYYNGQRAAVTLVELKAALFKVQQRHKEGQPKQIEIKPVVPKVIDDQVKSKTNLLQWLLGLFGTGTTGFLTFFTKLDWTQIVAAGGTFIGAMLFVLLFRTQLLGMLRDLREITED